MDRYTQSDPIGLRGGVNAFGYALQNPILYSDKFGLDVWVYVFRDGGSGYGHVGLSIPNGDGTYTRYSQGADDPNARNFELFTWQRDAVVHKTRAKVKYPTGSEFVKIPTENNSQIEKSIAAYIKADAKYNALSNNCADFVNDNINAADDVSVWGKTIPNKYFDKLEKLYR